MEILAMILAFVWVYLAPFGFASMFIIGILTCPNVLDYWLPHIPLWGSILMIIIGLLGGIIPLIKWIFSTTINIGE